MKEGERRRNGGNVLLQPDLPSNNTLHYGRALLNLAEIPRLTLTLDVLLLEPGCLRGEGGGAGGSLLASCPGTRLPQPTCAC